MRIKSGVSLVLVLLTTAFNKKTEIKSKDDESPSLVFLFADDQTFETISALGFDEVHDPRQAPQRFLDMYPLDGIKVPENFLPEYPWKDGGTL